MLHYLHYTIYGKTQKHTLYDLIHPSFLTWTWAAVLMFIASLVSPVSLDSPQPGPSLLYAFLLKRHTFLVKTWTFLVIRNYSNSKKKKIHLQFSASVHTVLSRESWFLSKIFQNECISVEGTCVVSFFWPSFLRSCFH